MKYFTGKENFKELRARYYALAKKHHPDAGGSVEAMQAINSEYNSLLQTAATNSGYTGERREYEINVDPILRAKIDAIIGIKNLVIEIIGSWLWVTGDTYPVKDTLKAEGFRFAPVKAAWSYHSGNYKKRSKRTLGFGEMRELFGSKKIETEQMSFLS